MAMSGRKNETAGDIRPPAVAGMFYPASRARLEAEVDHYLAGATVPDLGGQVRAVIAPHAGYVYSGPTAGFAFRALQSGLPATADKPVRIYLLGPAHQVWFGGVSTGDFDGFATPLGVAPVDREALQALWAEQSHYQPLSAAHRGEHCLEVEIPFLQRVVPQMQLVPLLFGQVDPEAVGQELALRLRDEPESRVVVSSDLSHFHDYGTARRMDGSFLEHVLADDCSAVEDDQQGACGRAPIAALMVAAAELGWRPHLLDYRTSGDTAGDKQRVVGYAALAYTTAG